MWQAGRKRDPQRQFADSRVVKVFINFPTIYQPKLYTCLCSWSVIIVVRFAVNNAAGCCSS